jgi:hypothetical protein
MKVMRTGLCNHFTTLKTFAFHNIREPPSSKSQLKLLSSAPAIVSVGDLSGTRTSAQIRSRFFGSPICCDIVRVHLIGMRDGATIAMAVIIKRHRHEDY